MAKTACLLLLLCLTAGLATAARYGSYAYGHSHHGGYYSGSTHHSGHPRPHHHSGGYSGHPRTHHHSGGYYGGHHGCSHYGGYGCAHGGSHGSSPPEPEFKCGAEELALVVDFSVFEPQAFEEGLPAFIHGLASLVSESADCITDTVDSAVARKLLSAPDAVTVTFTIATSDGERVAALLEENWADLQDLLRLLGGTIAGVRYTLYLRGVPVNMVTLLPSAVKASSMTPSPAAAPAAAPANAPADALEVPLPGALIPEQMLWAAAPAPAEAAPGPLESASISAAGVGVSASTKKSRTGAIIGGVIGGVGGALVLAGAAWFLLKKRHEGGLMASGGAASLRSTFATTNTAYNPAGATVTLTTGAADKGKVELEEVVEATGTPRSARCRVKTEFNNAENDAS